jgi:glycosyltransferase involved in cell wall biosynthesis
MMERDNISVDILLATYNGGEFLRELIESVLHQTHKDWRLIVRDDGSTDDTTSIVNEYAEKIPSKITIMQDDEKHLGACQSFARLMERSDSDYIMFCDQDDIWLPAKVSLALENMLDMEKGLGKDTPLLVHTDLKVVDEGLNPISNSFWEYAYLDPESGRTLNRLVIQNAITGCATLINKSLKSMSLPIPEEAIMHDWWIALVAASFGVIEYVPEPTILYRQHDRNKIGAREWDREPVFQKVSRYYREGRIMERISLNLKTIPKIRVDLLMTQRQAGAFADRYASSLNEELVEMTKAYSSLAGYGFLRKRYCIVKHGFYLVGFKRNFALFLSV